MAGADEIRWARRVRQDKIRRLYTLDAKGIVDEELIDEVGYAMLVRCESIRMATRAHAGKATCPRCAAKVEHAWDKHQALACPCGWETTWGEYLKTYQGKQLYGGNAYPMFRAFIDRWPAARTPRDKMLAIDALIHAVHGQFQGAMGRPAACNLIEGTARELVGFLDELAYGPQSTEGIAESRREWDAQVDLSRFAGWKRGRDST
ncbi:MAG TPA: hypothetical protein VFY79_12960 [Dehalococcoidia bacterium]|nr:hypothetical protein [Dehalococcoidia bacterium]